jgi:hypothetical protein
MNVSLLNKISTYISKYRGKGKGVHILVSIICKYIGEREKEKGRRKERGKGKGITKKRKGKVGEKEGSGNAYSE